MATYEVERTGDSVTTVRMGSINKGWEQYFLLRADAHRDHPCSNRAMETRHLEQAAERGAGVIDLGDLFCAMQGRTDPRSTADKRDEDVGDAYFDRLVDNAAGFYGKYADNWILLARGNHETKILKYNETDLTARLAEKMSSMSKNAGPFSVGGYCGWIRFMFVVRKKHCTQRRLFWTHGGGKGAPVTRGMIQTNRRAVYLPDADIVCGGHIHEAFVVPISRLRLSERGVETQDEQWHLQIPSYKDPWKTRRQGWEIEKEMAPKFTGAWWLRFYYESEIIKIGFEAAQ